MKINLTQTFIRLGLVGLLVNTIGANFSEGKFSDIMLLDSVTPVLVEQFGEVKVISQKDYNDIQDIKRGIEYVAESMSQGVVEEDNKECEGDSQEINYLRGGGQTETVCVTVLGSGDFVIDHGTERRYVYFWEDNVFDYGDGIDRTYTNNNGNMTFTDGGIRQTYYGIFNLK